MSLTGNGNDRLSQSSSITPLPRTTLTHTHMRGHTQPLAIYLPLLFSSMSLLIFPSVVPTQLHFVISPTLTYNCFLNSLLFFYVPHFAPSFHLLCQPAQKFPNGTFSLLSAQNCFTECVAMMESIRKKEQCLWKKKQ